MKFKAIITGLLAALLIVNAIGICMIVREEQEQTKIALAEYDAVSNAIVFYMDEWTYKYNDVIDTDGTDADAVWNIFESRKALGID